MRSQHAADEQAHGTTIAGTSLPFMRRATLPSTIKITLSARRATLGSCVTTTSVLFSLSRWRSSRIAILTWSRGFPGRLVGEQDVGRFDRASPPLALAARELVRTMVLAPGQTDRCERLVDAAAPFRASHPAEEQRQLDVAAAVSRGTRWKNWKTKPICSRRMRVSSSSGSWPAVAVEAVGAAAGPIEAADDVEERRLARSGRTHDRDVLAIGDDLVDPRQRVRADRRRRTCAGCR